MNANRLIIELDDALKMRKSGDFLGALARFERLEEISSHDRDIALLRLFEATCLTDLGRTTDALNRLLSIQRRRLEMSNQIDYEYERARVARALGNSTEALEHIHEALAMAARTPNRADVRVVSQNINTLHGILLSESGQCSQAIPILEAVPVVDEGWAQAKLALGNCLYSLRRFREAIVQYSDLISVNERTHRFIRNDAIRNIGSAYLELGEYRQAAEYLVQVEHAYDGRPDLKSDLFQMLHTVFLRLGMTERANGYSNAQNRV